MSDFFPPPPERPEREPFPAQPEWLGPPGNVLPGPVAASVLLGRSDQAVVLAHGLLAYPQGLAFDLLIRLRNGDAFNAFEPFGHAHFGGPLGPGPLPDDALRFGVQFADGRKATNLDATHWELHGNADPEGPMLTPRGGGGGGGTWDMSHWLWPLPSPGPLTFVIEWTGRGIALTRTEVDAGEILAAAERAEVLWPDQGDAPGGGFMMYGGE